MNDQFENQLNYQMIQLMNHQSNNQMNRQKVNYPDDKTIRALYMDENGYSLIVLVYNYEKENFLG